MGYVKEPDGIDFLIKSEPLTDEERLIISSFIKSDKVKKAAIERSKKVRKHKRKDIHS